MSYPEKYDEKLKRWSFDTLPFLPEKFLYEVIPSVEKQFNIVKGVLNREDVEIRDVRESIFTGLLNRWRACTIKKKNVYG